MRNTPVLDKVLSNEPEVIRMIEEGITAPKIAAKLEVSASAVMPYLVKRGYKIGKNKGNCKKKGIDKKAAYDLYQSGLTYANVADRLDCTIATAQYAVKSYAERNGLEIRVLERFVTALDEYKETIIQLLSEGMRVPEVAEKFEVMDQTLYKRLQVWGVSIKSIRNFSAITAGDLCSGKHPLSSIKSEVVITIHGKPRFKLTPI